MNIKNVFVLLALSGAIFAADAALFEMFAPEAGGMAPLGGGGLRERRVAAGQKRALPAQNDQAVYPFFHNATFTTTVDRVSQGYGGAEVVRGNIPGTHLRSISVYSPGGERHEIYNTENGRVYTAAQLGDGAVEIREHDPSAEPSWDEHVHVDGPDSVEPLDDAMGFKANGFSPLASPGAPVIDVMIVYDTAAAAWANNPPNGAGGVANLAQTLVVKMETALAASGVDCEIRLADVWCPAYTWDNNWGNALDSLRLAQGALSDSGTRRDTYGADVVSIMVDTGSAYGTVGVGYVNNAAGVHVGAGTAFSACAVRSVHISHTMTHEIGHNLGCGHSKFQLSSPAVANTHAAGWYFTGQNNTKYHTIMAYNSDGHGNSYSSAGMFSTPLLQHQGVTAGHVADGDNVRAIRENIVHVAAYRTPPGQLANPVLSTVGGAFTDRVQLTWPPVANATSYKIFRNSVNNPLTALEIGTANSTPYNDFDLAAGGGYYWAKASNASGDSGFSPTVLGNVKLDPATIPLGNAVNAPWPGLVWTTGSNTGSFPWFSQKIVTHDGSHAVQSGAVGNNNFSWLQTTVTGPGTMKFWWKVSSFKHSSVDTSSHLLRCLVNGSVVHYIMGEWDWHQQVVNVPAGAATIRWEYAKSIFSNLSGFDRGWLDRVEWRPDFSSNTRPVPITWFDKWYPGFTGDFNALGNETGLNGFANWESYVAGLNPKDPDSKFFAKIKVENGGVKIEWEPDLENDPFEKRKYIVWGCDTLTSGWTTSTNQNTRFFKVDVDLPGWPKP